jgi:hypothetical protein
MPMKKWLMEVATVDTGLTTGGYRTDQQVKDAHLHLLSQQNGQQEGFFHLQRPN